MSEFPVRRMRRLRRTVALRDLCRATRLSPADLIMRRIRVIGSQQTGTEYLHEALDFVAKGKVKVMTETYRLDEINRAYERVEKGQVRFRAVITA